MRAIPVEKRSMRAFFALIAAVMLCAIAAGSAGALEMPMPMLQLQDALRSAGPDAPGFAAYEVRDLATGYTSGYNMNAVMPAASTIKIPIMVEVFKQMAQGRFDLNRQVELLASDRDWGSGDLCDAPVGSRYPVSLLLTKMITVSDNTAANMLIRLVGRQDINDTMADLGLHHTRLANYIRTEEWDVRTSLRTTPSDMVHLLTDMAQHQLIDPWSSNEMIAILEQQQINTLLPEPLPDVPIAHKTGSFDDTLNDVGIVFGQEPYAIAVFTTDLSSLDAGRSFIHHLSRVTFKDMLHLARWRKVNPSPQQTVITDTPLWGTEPADN